MAKSLEEVASHLLDGAVDEDFWDVVAQLPAPDRLSMLMFIAGTLSVEDGFNVTLRGDALLLSGPGVTPL